MEEAPALSPISNPTILPNWIQGGANATLFLSTMPKPNHWVFCPGNSTDVLSGILMQDLSANCQSLLDTGQ